MHNMDENYVCVICGYCYLLTNTMEDGNFEHIPSLEEIE